MIRLYYSARTRAVRPRWLLEEMGIPYELERINLPELSTLHPQYTKIHPHGAVPALQDGGVTLIESGGICTYLAEKYPEKNMMPRLDSGQRPLFWQWMFYCAGTFEGPFTQLFQQTRGLPEVARSVQLAEKAREEFLDSIHFLEKSLGGKDYLLGSDFSVADIMLGHSLLNARRYQMLQDVPNLEKYLTQLEARPARQRANAD